MRDGLVDPSNGMKKGVQRRKSDSWQFGWDWVTVVNPGYNECFDHNFIRAKVQALVADFNLASIDLSYTAKLRYTQERVTDVMWTFSNYKNYQGENKISNYMFSLGWCCSLDQSEYCDCPREWAGRLFQWNLLTPVFDFSSMRHIAALKKSRPVSWIDDNLTVTWSVKNNTWCVWWASHAPEIRGRQATF